MQTTPANEASIRQAGAIIRQGGLVAFPTETVYGLGADAQNPKAIQRIYAAKGRPSDNPLIVHGNSIEELQPVADFTGPLREAARMLANAFWPGPLTLVLPRASAWEGPATVAVRVPAHPVFRGVIAASGCVIAAPSANLSGRPSPTLAQHVAADLSGVVDLILDGGPAHSGLESTVIDLHGTVPRLLRPGALTLEAVESVIGPVDCPDLLSPPSDAATTPLSPGMKYRHYAPQAPLVLVTGPRDRVKAYIQKRAAAFPPGKAGILPVNGESPEMYAQNLFRRLRRFDDGHCSIIFAEGVPEEGLGLAIMNRLRKAAAEEVQL